MKGLGKKIQNLEVIGEKMIMLSLNIDQGIVTERLRKVVAIELMTIIHQEDKRCMAIKANIQDQDAVMIGYEGQWMIEKSIVTKKKKLSSMVREDTLKIDAWTKSVKT